MRNEVFNWISANFGDGNDFRGHVSYTENVNEKQSKKDNKRYLFSELAFHVAVPYNPTDTQVIEWKDELYDIAEIAGEDRLKFELDRSDRITSPDDLDIATGHATDSLLNKRSIILRVNIFKKRPMEA